MLHDLYLLSCYFEPTHAILYEDELERRYGARAVKDAVEKGMIDLFPTYCGCAHGRFFCRLSDIGSKMVFSG